MRWCNAMFTSGRFVQGWRVSILAPIPKVPGTKKVLEQRPLCMMEVLRNMGVGTAFGKLKQCWQDEGLLDPMQYAFQHGKGTEGPLKIESAVNEDAFIYRKELHVVSQDISKAFDKVERTIGKEMGLRRLLTPEWLIEAVEYLDTDSEIYVRTAYGLTEALHPETGWPQGSEEGPDGWTAHYDWLLQLHREAEGRAPYVVEESTATDEQADESYMNMLRRHGEVGLEHAKQWAEGIRSWGIRITGAVFADDAKWWSRCQSGLQVAVDLSEDFLGFHGGQFNPEKSTVASIRWKDGDDPEATRWDELECDVSVEMVEPDAKGERTLSYLKPKRGDEPEKYLGVDSTCVVHWGEVEHKAAAIVKNIAMNCMRVKSRKYGARMMLRGVAAPKANCMLKYASSSDEQLESIWRPAEIAWKAATSMAISTSGQLHKGVAGAFADSTRVEQMMLMLQLLARKDMAGLLMRNEVARLQQMMGLAVQPLSVAWDEALGWRGDWLGRLWIWMSQRSITVRGGQALAPACEGDCAIMDLAMSPQERTSVSMACFKMEVYMLAELVMPNGVDLRQEVRGGGKWTVTGAVEATLCAVVLREKGDNGPYSTRLKTPLRGVRRGHTWCRRGRTMVARSSSGRLVLGRALAQCGRWLALEEWTPGGETLQRRCSGRAGVGLAAVGLPDVWLENKEGGRSALAHVECAYPVDMAGGRDVSADGHVIWRCNDSAAWTTQWHATVTAAFATMAHGADDEAPHQGEGCVRMPDSVALARDFEGWTEKTTEAHIPMRHSVEAPIATDGTLWATSDGSVKDVACEEASATFGWVARRNQQEAGWGNFAYTLCGMGVVEGPWQTLTSTRAEAKGLLEAMRGCRWLRHHEEWVRRFSFALDNEAAVKVAQTVESWQPLRWLKCTDRDVWRAIVDEMGGMRDEGVEFEVRWIRSHPERRMAKTLWTGDDVANHLADRWAEKAQEHHWVMDEGKAECGFKATALRWDMTHKGEVVLGKVRSGLHDLLRLQRREAGLAAARGWPSGAGMDWTLLHKIMREAKGNWLNEAVWWTKMVSGILATETVLTRRGRGAAVGDIAAPVCKLCGKAEENNWHALTQCTARVRVVDARRRMVKEIHGVLTKALGKTNSLLAEAMKAMWTLDCDGALCQWLDFEDGISELGLEPDAEKEGSEQEEALVRKCAQLHKLLGLQGGVESAAMGCYAVAWRQLVTAESGLAPGAALGLLVDVQQHVREGLRVVWKERNSERADWARAQKQTLQQQVEQALSRRRERARAMGKTIPVDADTWVRNMQPKKQRRWLRQQGGQQPSIVQYITRQSATEEEKAERRALRRRLAVGNLRRIVAARRAQTKLHTLGGVLGLASASEGCMPAVANRGSVKAQKRQQKKGRLAQDIRGWTVPMEDVRRARRRVCDLGPRAAFGQPEVMRKRKSSSRGGEDCQQTGAVETKAGPGGEKRKQRDGSGSGSHAAAMAKAVRSRARGTLRPVAEEMGATWPTEDADGAEPMPLRMWMRKFGNGTKRTAGTARHGKALKTKTVAKLRPGWTQGGTEASHPGNDGDDGIRGWLNGTGAQGRGGVGDSEGSRERTGVHTEGRRTAGLGDGHEGWAGGHGSEEKAGGSGASDNSGTGEGRHGGNRGQGGGDGGEAAEFREQGGSRGGLDTGGTRRAGWGEGGPKDAGPDGHEGGNSNEGSRGEGEKEGRHQADHAESAEKLGMSAMRAAD